MPDRKATFQLAIQNEIMSQNFYICLAKSFKSNPAVKETFLRLVPMEALHEEKLREAFQTEFPGSILTVDSSQALAIDPLDIKDPFQVINFAITREVIAFEIYTKMSEDSSDPALIVLFNELASEEADHKAILETDILRLEGLLTWYEPTELEGLWLTDTTPHS